MMNQVTVFAVLLLVLCLCTAEVVAEEAVVACAVIGVLLTWFGIPLAPSTIGFGTTISAKSLASTFMSLTARIGAGSGLVAAFQSIGAAGVSWTTVLIGGLLGALTGYLIHKRTARTEERRD
ncbi:hypothetical protein BsWGS_24343 [Bradybaena similaris]